MSQSSVTIQIVPESRPSTPSWLGEVAAFAQVLTHLGLLKAIQMHRADAGAPSNEVKNMMRTWDV